MTEAELQRRIAAVEDIQVGKAYYFISHAYYHFVGVLAKITGNKRGLLVNCVRVHSSPRNFTDFFREGFRDGDQYTHFPDGYEVTWPIGIAPWKHPIPEEKNEPSRRQR